MIPFPGPKYEAEPCSLASYRKIGSRQTDRQIEGWGRKESQIVYFRVMKNLRNHPGSSLYKCHGQGHTETRARARPTDRSSGSQLRALSVVLSVPDEMLAWSVPNDVLQMLEFTTSCGDTKETQMWNNWQRGRGRNFSLFMITWCLYWPIHNGGVLNGCEGWKGAEERKWESQKNVAWWLGNEAMEPAFMGLNPSSHTY